MNETGSIEHARKLAQKYKTEALEILNSIDFFKNEKATEELKTIVNFIVEREY